MIHGGYHERGLSGRPFLLLLLLVLAACGAGEGDAAREGAEGQPADPEVWEGDVVEAARLLRPREGTQRDWEILRSTLSRAWEGGLDSLPMGEAMVEIGLTFLGTPYAPSTLELAGPERVVVNLEEFDCVTYLENVLALARFIKIHDPGILETEERLREAYRRTLQEIRYRGARVDGYSSRLHYFSDWIRDNEAKGLVRELTREVGGRVDPKAIDYMSTHPEAYRQLANPANLLAIQEIEADLSRRERFKIPQEEIGTLSSRIRNGDIVAATSTVEGLDVAHTGLALWQGSDLHLVHAPLIGGVVEVSQLPLADRMLRLSGQDGIRIARPLDPSGVEGESRKP